MIRIRRAGREVDEGVGDAGFGGEEREETVSEIDGEVEVEGGVGVVERVVVGRGQVVGGKQASQYPDDRLRDLRLRSAPEPHSEI